MKGYYRNKSLKPFSRELRTFGTKGEAVLWKKVLKAKQVNGYQFNRQFIIEDYIVDFICRDLNLIIEIDGSSHSAKNKEDANRQLRLEELGFTVLHFTEFEVLYDLEGVNNKIYYSVQAIEDIRAIKSS